MILYYSSVFPYIATKPKIIETLYFGNQRVKNKIVNRFLPPAK
jgi:hypothetical protein